MRREPPDPKQPSRRGPKGKNQDGEAIALIERRVVAGDTNEAIRMALHNAGYTSDYSDQALYKHRKKPHVLEALRYRKADVLASGLAERMERIVHFKGLAAKFYAEIEKIFDPATRPVDEDGKVGKLPTLDLYNLTRSFVLLTDRISKLADGDTKMLRLLDMAELADTEEEAQAVQMSPEEQERQALETFLYMVDRIKSTKLREGIRAVCVDE